MEEEILYSVKVEGVVSIENLTKANKALREERKNLDLQSEAGQKRVKELNDELDKNNKKIKDNVSSLEKQKINIGNYASAIDKLIPGFDGLSQAVSGSKTFIEGGTKSIGGMSTAMKFMLGPIGLILTALSLFVGWLKGSEEGGDLLAKRMMQLEAIFDVVADRAIKLGGAIFKLFTGDLIGATEEFSAAVSGVGDEMGEAIRVAGELADVLDTLEDRERAYKAAASDTTLEIKRLILESKNRTLSEQEKIDKLNEAFKLESEQNKTLRKIKEDALNVALRQFEQDAQTLEGRRKLNETDAEYAKRILEVTKNSKGEYEVMNELGSAKDLIAKATEELNAVEGESLNLQEKLSNMIDAQTIKQEEKSNKLIELRQKEIESLNKIQAAEDEAFIKTIERDQKKLESVQNELLGYEARQKAAQDLADTINVTAEIEQEQADQLDQNTLDAIESGRKRVAADKSKAIETLNIADKVSTGLSNIFKKGSDASKVAAIADIGVNTALGFIQGLDIAQKSAKGTGPLAAFSFPLFYATQIAAVLGAAGRAKGAITAAAGGGDFITKGPTMLMVGDNPGGVERVTVTPISGKGKTVVGDGMIKLAGGGSVTAAGSSFISSTARASESSINFNQMMQAFTQVPIVVTVEDINAGVSRVDNIVNRARVI